MVVGQILQLIQLNPKKGVNIVSKFLRKAKLCWDKYKLCFEELVPKVQF